MSVEEVRCVVGQEAAPSLATGWVPVDSTRPQEGDGERHEGGDCGCGDDGHGQEGRA